MLDRRQVLAAGGAIAIASAARGADAPLDTAIVGARAWTGDPRHPRTDAIGIVGDRIVALGAAAVRARTTSRTRVIDLDGAFALPAFIDNHAHFLLGSNALAQPDLLVDDRATFVARIAGAVRRQPGRWLLGGSWDEQRMGGRLPDRTWIDGVTGDTPIALPRTDLHSYFCNSAALRLAGITRDTPDPAGGEIVRDARGEPTGIVKDNAKTLVERVIPPQTPAQIEEAFRAGIAHGLSHGIAQVHLPNPFDWVEFDTLRRLRAKGETDMRFYSFVPLRDWEKLAAFVRQNGRGDDWVRWGGVKALVDGSLGARTALFHEPYTDDPSTRGVRIMPIDELRAATTGADRAGLQVTVHAIGDEANDDILDVYADVVRANGARDRRFRVEHAQHCRPATIPRFARQRVIASVQPYHAIDDGRWAVKRIGEKRLDGTYAFGSLMNSGATVTFGADWPVAPFDAIQGIQAAVTRETIDGANPRGWLPDQKVTAEQALVAYTRNNAYAGFQDDRLGRLVPGFLADITVLDRDPTAIDPASIRETKVLRTIVGGRTRFAA